MYGSKSISSRSSLSPQGSPLLQISSLSTLRCGQRSSFFWPLCRSPFTRLLLRMRSKMQTLHSRGTWTIITCTPQLWVSAIFGILWKNAYGAKEKWYAKPLVYTPPGQSQLVFLASSMNIIRTVDAVNGTLLNSRTVQPPFLQSDIGCTDIPDYIGIIVSYITLSSSWHLVCWRCARWLSNDVQEN